MYSIFSEEFISYTLKMFAIFFVINLVALTLNPGWLFYDQEVYINHLRSIISDGDLNIINQVSTRMGWLVTKHYFHPDSHPITQLIFLLPFYLIEKSSAFFSYFSNAPEFALAAIGVNIFCIILGWHFIKECAKILNLKYNLLDFLLFYFATPLSYFSLLQATVIEISAFPLIAYLMLVFFKFQKDKNIQDPVIVLSCCAFLMITKITFIPICVLVITLFFHPKTTLKPNRAFIWPASIFFGIFLAHFWMRWIQYGRWINTFPPVFHFFDFSLSNIFSNLKLGFFPRGGLFFSSPMFFISALGSLFFLFKSYRTRYITRPASLFLALWLCWVYLNGVCIIGYVIEDQLPGRIHLAVSPLLILGLIQIGTFVQAKMRIVYYGLLAACCLWHFYIVLNYIVVVQINSYDYAQNTIPHLDLFTQGLTRYITHINHSFFTIKNCMVHIAIFSLACSIGTSWIALRNKVQNTKYWFCYFCLIIFFSVAMLNGLTFERNIEKLRANRFFDKIAVGNGLELFTLDYAMDFAKYIESRGNAEVNKKLTKIVENYYEMVKKQVIKSTPELDAAIATRAIGFSYLVETESQK